MLNRKPGDLSRAQRTVQRKAARKQAKRRAASAFEVYVPKLPMRPVHVLAIDPGQVHCGMAWFTDDPKRGWGVVQVADMEPADCIRAARTFVHEVVEANFDSNGNPHKTMLQTGVLVVEGFQLYPGKLQEQGFSRMGTPEVIGALKWMYLDECWSGWRSRNQRRALVAMYEQGASVKIRGCEYNGGRCQRVEGKGLVHDPVQHEGHNPHERDAEAHGWYRIRLIEETWKEA